MDLLVPPLDLLLIELGMEYPRGHRSLDVCIDLLFDIIRRARSAPSFLPIDKRGG